MADATTRPAHGHTAIPGPPGAAGTPRPSTGGLSGAVEGQRFRVRTPSVATPWLPDTPSTRYLAVVWFRRLVAAHGKPWFTLQAGATIVGSTNRQAARQQVEDFRECGEDLRAFVLRQRTGDATVVDAVLAELLQTPLAGPTALVPRVHAHLGRNDLRAAHIAGAWEPISCVPVLRTLRRQLAAGQVHSQEAGLLTELRESLSLPAPLPAGGSGPSADRGMRLAAPTALAVWPTVSQWIIERVTAQMVSVDEKGLKSRGRWHYGCVVVEVPPELPVLAAFLPSRSPWAWRCIGRQLRGLKHVARVIITDGLPAYAYLGPAAKHVLCRFQPPQGVTHWRKPHFATAAEIDARKPVMQRVVQTRDTRTVRRRLARLRARAPAGGITAWVAGVEAKVPRLMRSVGSVCVPSTTHAMERFFRAFARFYNTRQGLHSVLSATRALLRLLVVSVFTPRATDGHAPSAAIVPEARRMPLSRLIHDPLRALQARGNVKREPPMADLLRPQAAGA